MKTRFAGTLFGLAVLLLCEVAWAQKVVVLEFEGDRRNRVRLQVVRELLKDGGVELAAVDDFERLAAKKGLKGKRAMTTEAVAAVGVELGVVAALDGDVGRKAFRFRILDGKGTELFAREVPLSKGTLSAKNARRIAAALVAAARTPPRAAPAVAEAAPAQEEKSAETPAEAEEATAEVAVPASAREVDRVAEDRRRRDPEYADSHTRVGAPSYEEEFEPVRRRPRGSQVGPKLLTVHLGGTTTWRAYCSRPGVAACGDYDALAVGARPAGDKVDFSPKVPYAGFGIGLDFFPLASMENFAKGFGVNAGFSRGFSLTNVTVETPDGTKSPEKQVVSVDDAWHALLAYRFYFGMGTTVPLPAYVGVRGGISARTFEVDPNAAVPLPGSHRRYPTFGLDVSIPLAKLIRLEGSGTYFVDPRPGVDEIAGYGAEGTGQGWSAEAGVAGDIWGPIGYEVRFRWMSFKDRFTGAGNKWAEGGAAEESYTGLNWGLTASF